MPEAWKERRAAGPRRCAKIVRARPTPSGSRPPGPGRSGRGARRAGRVAGRGAAPGPVRAHGRNRRSRSSGAAPRSWRADLATGPVTGMQVEACGDAHVGNFGKFATPGRSLIFDINDFDETLPGPWEWDVKRLAASMHVVALGSAPSAARRATASSKPRCAPTGSTWPRRPRSARSTSGTPARTSVTSSRTSRRSTGPVWSATSPRRAARTTGVRSRS